MRNQGPNSFPSSTSPPTLKPTTDDPLDSAIILSPHGDTYKLYARDIARLPIHANLVTLSACRSAGSRTYAGEGLVGFAWAFLEAGAQNVVAGLWEVDDASTAKLMEAMYAQLRRGATPQQALRTAKHGACCTPRVPIASLTTGRRSR